MLNSQNQFEGCQKLSKDSRTRGYELQQGTENEASGSQQSNIDSESVSHEIDVCSVEGINKDGGVACKNICSPHSCCFATEAIFNCRNIPTARCTDFEKCEIFFKTKH